MTTDTVPLALPIMATPLPIQYQHRMKLKAKKAGRLRLPSPNYLDNGVEIIRMRSDPDSYFCTLFF